MTPSSFRPTRRFAVILAAGAAVACTEAPATSPSAPLADVPLLGKVTAVAGSYQLEFYSNRMTVVTSLPVMNELVLGAHVEDLAGNDAQSGSVTFEYCSLKGGPPNDITRADEAPLEACADGSASWARLLSLSVNATGDAFMNFGYASIPRTVGFRFKFNGGRSGIASGVSVPRNFTWTAQ
jgi:hypothetical protein